MSDQPGPHAYNPQGTMFNGFNNIGDGKDHTFDYIMTEDIDSSLNDLFLEPITTPGSTQANLQQEPVHQVPVQFTQPINEPQGVDGFVPSTYALNYSENLYTEANGFEGGLAPMLSQGMCAEFADVEYMNYPHWMSQEPSSSQNLFDFDSASPDCEIIEHNNGYPADEDWNQNIDNQNGTDVNPPSSNSVVFDAPLGHRVDPPKRYKTQAKAGKVIKPKKTTTRRSRRASTTDQRVPQPRTNVAVANDQQRAEELREKRRKAVQKSRKKMADYLVNAPKEIAYKTSVMEQVDALVRENSQLLEELRMIQARNVPQLQQGGW